MKTVQWVLIACRVLAVCFGLTLLSSGCGDESGASRGVTTEEQKRDAESRKAMEAASKAASKAARHK